MSIRPQDHITAAPAISAVRPAFRHKFFPSETDAPAPAFSRLRKNLYPIDKHGAFKVPLAVTYVIPRESKDLPLEAPSPHKRNVVKYRAVLLRSFNSLTITIQRK